MRWKGKHVAAFGFAAFILPELLGRTLGPDHSLNSIVDATLLFQIIGYVLAIVLAAVMVTYEQHGDWSSVGITWDDSASDDLLRGAGFGLLMFGGFAAVAFALNNGQFSVEGIVNVLLGGTSGMGLLFVAIVVVVGAPVIEEIFFRGILYEKLARTDTWLAIIVTTVLFTRAHGAFLIPAIMLLGFGLAYKRRTKTLWYTIGGHASWNLAVVCLAAFTLFGAAKTFSPPDAAYTLKHAADWRDASGEANATFTEGNVDLALASTHGSAIGVIRLPVIGGSAERTLSSLVSSTDEIGYTNGFPRTEIRRSSTVFDDLAEGYEIAFEVPASEGVPVHSHMLVVVKPGSPQAYLFNLICPEPSCVQDEKDFQELLRSVRFAA